MRVYISGKITGLDPEKAKGHFARASELVEKLGYKPVNPMVEVPFDPEYKWEDYMLKDIALLFGCDAILMLPNWEDSKGAKIEHAIAQLHGLQVLFTGWDYKTYSYNPTKW